MRRRLRKKLHKRVLELEVIDLSLCSSWRSRLFSAEPYKTISIDRDGPTDIPKRLRNLICRYNLRFDASTVSPSDTEPWLSEGGMVIFRFRAQEFPSVRAFTGNNPDAK